MTVSTPELRMAFAVVLPMTLPNQWAAVGDWSGRSQCAWTSGGYQYVSVTAWYHTLQSCLQQQQQQQQQQQHRYLSRSAKLRNCQPSCLVVLLVSLQEFFAKDMGLPLTMTPNYEDFSCQ
jgi:hypothetical protein